MILDAAVIVAHPDDELLWAGGLIIQSPSLRWLVFSVCRGQDPDRAPKFAEVQKRLGTIGMMGNLDDEPEQRPLNPKEVQLAILSALPETDWHRIVTHGPRGEYTRHRRHEEVCAAVVELCASGKIHAEELWFFNFGDAEGSSLPVAQRDADYYQDLPAPTWDKKYELLTEVYGFTPDSWEARSTPRSEAFRTFTSSTTARAWVKEQQANLDIARP